MLVQTPIPEIWDGSPVDSKFGFVVNVTACYLTHAGLIVQRLVDEPPEGEYGRRVTHQHHPWVEACEPTETEQQYINLVRRMDVIAHMDEHCIASQAAKGCCCQTTQQRHAPAPTLPLSTCSEVAPMLKALCL